MVLQLARGENPLRRRLVQQAHIARIRELLANLQQELLGVNDQPPLLAHHGELKQRCEVEVADEGEHVSPEFLRQQRIGLRRFVEVRTAERAGDYIPVILQCDARIRRRYRVC